jgi:hypothetical protein
MKSTLSEAAFQAMSLMIGSAPNANSKRSLFSNKTGIAFSSGVTPVPKTETDIQRRETFEEDTKDDASDFGNHGRRSTRGPGRGRAYTPIARKKSAIQLGVGRKLRQQEFRNKRRIS